MSVNGVSIFSGNGLSPVRRQAIIWTSADVLSIEPLETNFSEIRIKVREKHSTNNTPNFNKIHHKVMAYVEFSPGNPAVNTMICAMKKSNDYIVAYMNWRANHISR